MVPINGEVIMLLAKGKDIRASVNEVLVWVNITACEFWNNCSYGIPSYSHGSYG